MAHYQGLKKRYVINFGILEYMTASHETDQFKGPDTEEMDPQTDSNSQPEGTAKIMLKDLHSS